MGVFYSRPETRGPNPYTRSGEPPPKLNITKEKDRPSHRVYDPMSLELHMGDERVRAAGLTPAEREWRQKFLKTEQLHPDEPIHVDAVHRQMNPVRVIYRMPWDYIYKHFLRPTFGAYRATLIRAYVPRMLTLWTFVLCFHYYWKYEMKTWERALGVSPFYNLQNYDLYNDDHDEQSVRIGLPRPDLYHFFDREFVHRIQKFPIGETNRPW